MKPQQTHKYEEVLDEDILVVVEITPKIDRMKELVDIANISHKLDQILIKIDSWKKRNGK